MLTRLPARPLPLLGFLALAACGGGQKATGPGPEAPKAAAQPAKPQPIRIGEYGSLTGSTATFGLSTKNGVDLALAEINAAGGVKGRPLEVIVEDDQGKPEEAAAVVQKLINKDRVVAIIGEVASSRSLAAAPICQANGVPMVTPSSTNPAVTAVGDYIFRVCFIDSFQGEVMAQFARENLKASTSAVLTDIKNDYSVGLAEFYKTTFTKLGGKVVSEVSYSEGDKDFKGQLTTIKRAKPDVIFVPGYYTEAGLIAQQARELGIQQTILGGDGWESPKLLEIGGAALEGAYYCNHYFAGAPIPRIQEFVAKYRTRFGEDPDSIAALAYDAAKLLASAMEASSTLAGSEIRDILAQTKGYEGVTGTTTLDANRNPVKPAVILKIEKGAIGFVTEIGGATATAGTPTAPQASETPKATSAEPPAHP
jgi:branched-chain amino acid transport system substrate-binding protein